MNAAQSRMIELLRPVLGSSGIVVDPEAIAPWLTDWRRRYHGRAPAMFQPVSVEQVQSVVRAALECGVPLVPQGGNTSMVGGATPSADGSGVILSLRHMNRLRSLDPHGGLAVAEAGMVLENLHAAAVAQGSRFPLTLGARGSATVGGLVSTNAGGTQVLRFGTMRGLVAGLEAVLPDGSIHHGLAALKKDNRGYDLDQLLVGAEGTLGIVTAATLRLMPAIVSRAVAWVGVDTPTTALELLRRLQARTDAVESFEIMPAETVAAALAYLPDSRPPLAGSHRWHLLIEATSADGAGEAPSTLLERLLSEALSDGGIADAVVASSEAQAEAFWRLRDSLSDAERSTGPAMQHDISVPADVMPAFMVDAAAMAEQRFPGTRASGFGHLGDGNIHFHVRAPAGAERVRWTAEQGPAITRFVHDMVVAAGGSISAEHGIGQMKLDELARLSDPARLFALRAIKGALDPSGLFNPGKLVPLAPADRTP